MYPACLDKLISKYHPLSCAFDVLKAETLSCPDCLVEATTGDL